MPWLVVDRVGDNVVARSMLGRPQRVVLAGHLDTVPVNGNATARIDGDVLHGLGSADMKGGLAVVLHLAETLDPALLVHDVTLVFYVCEEVAAVHNGLRALFEQQPDLLAGDVAILGEPTQAVIEAGCQGTMRVRLTLGGAALTHGSAVDGPQRHPSPRCRVGPARCVRRAAAGDRRLSSTGEALQAVHMEGGVAGNVVPDRVGSLINHRFAPDRDTAAALVHVRAVIGDDVLGDDATLEIVDVAEGAVPGMSHPILACARPRRRRAGLGEVGMDRCGVLLGPWDSRGELRTG